MEEKADLNPGNFIENITLVLQEYWTRFLFLLPNIIFAVIILVITLFIANKVKRLLNNSLGNKSHDQLTVRYIAVISKWAIVIVGILLAFQTLGLTGVAGGLLAGAGLSAVVIGFAFKDIGENFLAGIILAFNRPFNVQDTIEVNDVMGKVMSLDLRTTHILTFDSKDVYVPNATILKSEVINYTRNGLIRTDFIVGIDFNDDIEKAIELIEKTAARVDGVLQKDPPYVAVDELGTNTVNLKVFFWTETDDYKKGFVLLKSNVIKAVKRALLENGFGLPANIQELKLYDYQKSLPVTIKNMHDNSTIPHSNNGGDQKQSANK